MKRRFPLADNREYLAAVSALWELPHREEKYLALGLAQRHDRFVTHANLGFYKTLIRQGAWWDLVDDAYHLVGRALQKDPQRVFAAMDLWIEDDDIWVKRVAIICQLQLKQDTDAGRLFDYCRRNLGHQEFFHPQGHWLGPAAILLHRAPSGQGFPFETPG